jgi:hypothetical protein
MAGESIAQSAEAAYKERDWLLNYALAEQRRINRLPIDADALRAETGELIKDLDEACTWYGKDVCVSGQRFFEVPILDPTASADDSAELLENSTTTQAVLGPDETLGESHGFIGKLLPVLMDQEVIGQRYVVCHLVHDGVTIRGLDNNCNMVDIKQMAAYPIETSRLQLQEEAPFDPRELRHSDDELYADIDMAVLNDAPFSQQLTDLQAAVEAHGFANLPAAKQQEVVGYLNCYRFFAPLQLLRANYALSATEEEGNATLVILANFLGAHIHNFVAVDTFRLERTAQGYNVTATGIGVGLKAEIIDEDNQEQEIILPLNQIISFAGEIGDS